MIDPGNKTVYEYLAESMNACGGFNAFVHRGNKVSSKRFLADVERLAAFLDAKGIHEGDVFTVFLPTCPQATAAFYALNKIGVIANIVHPLTPPDVFAGMVEKTASKGVFVLDILAEPYIEVITEKGLMCVVCSNSDYVRRFEYPFYRIYESAKCAGALKKLKYVTYRTVVTDKTAATVETVKGNGDETCVYLHGGGTTGKSCTIMLSSVALNALAFKIGKLDTPHKTGTEYSLAALPLFHAFGLGVCAHFSLCAGYGLICLPKFSAKKAVSLIKRYPVCFIVGVPNMFKKIYDMPGFKGEALKRLRLLFSGGDTVDEAFLERFNVRIAEYGGTGRLMRGYGLTETSSVCCTNSYGHTKPESIGVPLDGIIIEIVGPDGQVLPAGETGEIAVGGDTVMNGYLGDEEQNNAVLYTGADGVRRVLTGDLGYKDDDGYLFFTGRKKRIIIISGYNVYPSTIEKTVLSLGFVRECCAVQGYESGKSIVKLYVVTDRADETAAVQEIRDYCEKKLERFLQPRKIMVIDSLPRTSFGKVDFMKLSDKLPLAGTKK